MKYHNFKDLISMPLLVAIMVLTASTSVLYCQHNEPMSVLKLPMPLFTVSAQASAYLHALNLSTYT